ncbi:LysR substrate-binding domain-containing protein [Microlunatus flavus]|uniref:DNA-binding transcriptional regulator, LysR family n=1 Tax=Microlunatus flavus TaxID=1036181 RepID=A0A1H9JL26_9ACTN|nr:LysR substrate-binding domain-containing protein [Microlunatus flavus]SEQ87604.1 DNA-binding transcriptional regulator, LysR family [Microlunatus flavus]
MHGAATTLGYTPSAISQQVSALQRATGLALTARDGRRIVPTAAARQLADEADRVFEALAGLDLLVADLRAGRDGTLTVGYFASAGSTWVPPVIATVTKEYPRLRLDLRLVEGATTYQPDVEIFVEGVSQTTTPEFGARHLVEEPYYVVVRRDSDLAVHDRIPLSLLAGEAWIDNDVTRGPCRQVVLNACSAAGFTPTFRVETHDYASAVQFVAENLGITVLPRLGAQGLPPSTRAIPVVDPTPTRRIGVRVRKTVARNPAAVRLVELLEAQAGVLSEPAPTR